MNIDIEREEYAKNFCKGVRTKERRRVYNKLIGVWMELNKKHKDGNKAYAELGKYIRKRCGNSQFQNKKNEVGK